VGQTAGPVAHTLRPRRVVIVSLPCTIATVISLKNNKDKKKENKRKKKKKQKKQKKRRVSAAAACKEHSKRGKSVVDFFALRCQSAFSWRRVSVARLGEARRLTNKQAESYCTSLLVMSPETKADTDRSSLNSVAMHSV
jgi:hypothetical protein